MANIPGRQPLHSQLNVNTSSTKSKKTGLSIWKLPKGGSRSVLIGKKGFLIRAGKCIFRVFKQGSEVCFQRQAPIKGSIRRVDATKPFKVGRAEEVGNHYVLMDDTLSGEHLTVEIEKDGNIKVTDLNSSNGTTIGLNPNAKSETELEMTVEAFDALAEMESSEKSGQNDKAIEFNKKSEEIRSFFLSEVEKLNKVLSEKTVHTPSKGFDRVSFSVTHVGEFRSIVFSGDRYILYSIKQILPAAIRQFFRITGFRNTLAAEFLNDSGMDKILKAMEETNFQNVEDAYCKLIKQRFEDVLKSYKTRGFETFLNANEGVIKDLRATQLTTFQDARLFNDKIEQFRIDKNKFQKK